MKKRIYLSIPLLLIVAVMVLINYNSRNSNLLNDYTKIRSSKLESITIMGEDEMAFEIEEISDKKEMNDFLKLYENVEWKKVLSYEEKNELLRSFDYNLLGNSAFILFDIGEINTIQVSIFATDEPSEDFLVFIPGNYIKQENHWFLVDKNNAFCAKVVNYSRKFWGDELLKPVEEQD